MQVITCMSIDALLACLENFHLDFAGRLGVRRLGVRKRSKSQVDGNRAAAEIRWMACRRDDGCDGVCLSIVGRSI